MPRLPKANFYLKADKDNEAVVYLRFVYSGVKISFFFGLRIKKGNWSLSKQRVKNNKQTTDDGKYLINDLLKALENECEKAYNELRVSGIPPAKLIEIRLKAVVDGKPVHGVTLYDLIDRFIKGEIKTAKGKSKAPATLVNYKVTLRHLKAFEVSKKMPVTFESINLEFYRKFVQFLENPVKVKLADGMYERNGLSINSVGNQIKNLKAFMAEGVDQDLTDNLQFTKKKFVKVTEETDAVYLTDQERMKLFNTDFSNNKTLDHVKDLFCFGCYTGLRFSDYSAVKPENIVNTEGELFIKMKTKKTGDTVIIPCDPVVLQIFEKYKHNANRLPPGLSNQKFNDYIKQVCEHAGLTEAGRLETDMSKPLHECVSSHTARRSFATNLYLENYPPIEIMKVTGHKTEAAFLKYIKVTKLNAAKRLSAHMKEMWSRKILKAV